MSPTTVLVFQTLFVGVLGACIGSFLNVVILRIQAEKPFLAGRSKCPKCGRTLRWWELVPIASFVMVGGRCQRCHKHIHLQYILVEALSATMFMVVWLALGWSLSTLVGLAVVASMILVAAYDARWQLIPDQFSYFFIGASIVWALAAHRSWVESGIGLVVGGAFFGLQYLLSKGKWIGSGDIFIGLGLGVLLGWKMFLVAVMMAYLLGAVIAVVQLAIRRAKISTTIPFGPYLMLAGFLVWLFGFPIVNWYLLYAHL